MSLLLMLDNLLELLLANASCLCVQLLVLLFDATLSRLLRRVALLFGADEREFSVLMLSCWEALQHRALLRRDHVVVAVFMRPALLLPERARAGLAVRLVVVHPYVDNGVVRVVLDLGLVLSLLRPHLLFGL